MTAEPSASRKGSDPVYNPDIQKQDEEQSRAAAVRFLEELSKSKIFGIKLLNGSIMMYSDTGFDARRFHQSHGTGMTIGNLRDLLRDLR